MSTSNSHSFVNSTNQIPNEAARKGSTLAGRRKTIVHVESDFRAPLRHGDVITVEVATARLGTRSVTMRYRTFRPGDEAVAAEGTVTQACVEMDGFRTIAIPDEIRAAFARHVVA